MHPSYWTYVLRLMGLIVMVDKKVYQEEVQAFVKAAMHLQKTVSPNMIMTKKMAMEWFVSHREHIKDTVYTLDYDRELVEALTELHPLPEKVEVLKAMISVALSDGYYHGKEKMIIQKAILHWGIDPSVVAVE